MSLIFKNRTEAGRVLAEELKDHTDRKDVFVLALPRGGVPVGFEVANALRAPLDVFIVRKLGVPGREELAFGAIASGRTIVLNDDIVWALRLSQATIEHVSAQERIELERREKLYRGSKAPLDVQNKTIIIVDDGLATGATMSAAIKALRRMGPEKIVVAVPVASRYVCDQLERPPDVWCVCARTPEPFYGVGMWYDDFSQTTDQEVIDLLDRSAASNGNVRKVQRAVNNA